jgi:hypothetical protein
MTRFRKSVLESNDNRFQQHASRDIALVRSPLPLSQIWLKLTQNNYSFGDCFSNNKKILRQNYYFIFKKQIQNNLKFRNRKKKNAAVLHSSLLFFSFPFFSFFLSGGEISPKREF